MQTIVFIETNKSGSSREAIKAAERLGYFTVLLTNKKNYLQHRSEFPEAHNIYYMESLDINILRQKIKFLKFRGKQISAVLSFIDPFVHIAAQLSEEFSQTTLNKHVIYKMEDKIQTRKELEGYSFSPFYKIFDPKNERFKPFLENNEHDFPLIVKSPTSTGSKDVLYVEGPEQLKTSIQSLVRKYPDQPVLVEEYLDGPQCLLEVIVQNDEIHLVAVVQQEISKQERFIVTGYGLLIGMEDEKNHEFYRIVKEIVSKFNIINGAFHLELKYANGKWKLIEINPRISGGAMNSLIKVGFGINLVEETIKMYLGQRVDLKKSHQKFVYAHYITLNANGRLIKVTGKQRALRRKGVVEVFIKPRKGMRITPPLSMGHRYGYVLAVANTLIEARTIAESAAKDIRFHLHPM